MTTEGNAVDIRGVSHRFTRQTDGQQVLAVDNVSISIPRHEFIAIVGSSGCGKTTLLNMIAGIVHPSDGEVLRGTQRVIGPDRSIGYMTAKSGLLPWRTALENVELGLEYRKIAREERRERAATMLRRVGLADFTSALPGALSHGMQQRVALARTLVVEPEYLLMDEPFAALDAQTKIEVEAEFTQLWEDNPKTVVFVTHDLNEAVALADRVVVMTPRPGRVALDLKIDLPRPRGLEEVRFLPEFQELTERVWRALAGKESS